MKNSLLIRDAIDFEVKNYLNVIFLYSNNHNLVELSHFHCHVVVVIGTLPKTLMWTKITLTCCEITSGLLFCRLILNFNRNVRLFSYLFTSSDIVLQNGNVLRTNCCFISVKWRNICFVILVRNSAIEWKIVVQFNWNSERNYTFNLYLHAI